MIADPRRFDQPKLVAAFNAAVAAVRIRAGLPAQYGQFKHKEVIIGKLEPRMDANEREFLRSS
jgi:hypothetical protein